MMGQRDDSPIPPYAVQCWESETDIFVALPMTAGGIPYIMRFPRNEGGLSAALAVLSKRKREVLAPTHDSPANYTAPKHQPMVKQSKVQERLYAETTPEQRESARKLLEKLGIK
jgi:hypothetical protein